METISASEFKAKCLALLDEVAEGSEIVVTKRGKPVARLVPVRDVAADDLLGSVTYHVTEEELIAPLEAEWTADVGNLD